MVAMLVLVIGLLAVNVWLYLEVRVLRRRLDEEEENMEITWTWCDTHAKEHIKLEERMKRIEEGLDLDPDALGRAEREERLFFDGMSSILNYTYDQARKAGADE